MVGSVPPPRRCPHPEARHRHLVLELPPPLPGRLRVHHPRSMGPAVRLTTLAAGPCTVTGRIAAR
eukprot:9087399-Prorocentrum_lima.AAC.1